MIHEILEKINSNNSTNHKLAVLVKNKDNELLKKVFKYALDTITYTYGISAQRWLKDPIRYAAVTESQFENTVTLEDFFGLLESLAKREITGNAAEDRVEEYLRKMSTEDAALALKILGRDLKLNIGKTVGLKVWKDLIAKPCYMRCDIYGPKTKKNIQFPALLQIKADGTYREAYVNEEGEVSFVSRAGKVYEYPTIAKQMSNFKPGYYIGELTVTGVENRAIGNGMINSDEVPHDKLLFELWDYVTQEEYSNAKNKIKNKTEYKDRFDALKDIESWSRTQVSIIPGIDVHSIEEAGEKTALLMKQGFEGAILKDPRGVFADTTSKHQLKLKISFSIDVRVVGFQEGTPGTKREKTFGAMIFESDDGKIKGRCSGFTDKELEEINADRGSWIGAIIEVEGNDLTKGENNEHYAVSHPRFIERRNDKTETDTLERALDSLEMGKNFNS